MHKATFSLLNLQVFLDVEIRRPIGCTAIPFLLPTRAPASVTMVSDSPQRNLVRSGLSDPISPSMAPLWHWNPDILTESLKNSSTLRRLAADHSSLHVSGLPPNYLFPPQDGSSNPDDLTQLTVLLTGSQGTPYSQGLWQLQLKIPNDYPKSPPKAAFKTRIWHPNVEESTGSVCVDTLKKDWESKLTLRDILIVSSSR